MQDGGGRGSRRVFVGPIKNFKHILMVHEISLKISDGPRNIFLCSPLILIFKLRESEHKLSKLAIIKEI